MRKRANHARLPTSGQIRVQRSDENINHVFVERIRIFDLFGLYTYDLGNDDSTTNQSSRLFLLYGDNGSGKTTVLKLVFHLLAKARNERHRTSLNEVPFRRLDVHLSGDVVISAVREESELTGPYHLSVHFGQDVLFNHLIITEGPPSETENTELALNKYTDILDDLGVKLFFLSDQRQTLTGAPTEDESDGDDEDDSEMIAIRSRVLRARYLERSRAKPKYEDNIQMLELAVSRFENWIRNQVMQGSSTGEANTNSIYTDIVKRLSKEKGPQPASRQRTAAVLLNTLREIQTRNQAYAAFGLASPLDVDAIVSAVNTSPKATKTTIANVLTPYVDGLKARLEALSEIEQTVSAFVDGVNSFLYNKTLSLNVKTGIGINVSNGSRLPLRMLSSGERQLLLLFCNTILIRSSPSIFFIDEPEISLNVKWQRKLLDSLSTMTQGSPVQFVIATHSLELLTRHKGSIHRLDSIAQKQ